MATGNVIGEAVIAVNADASGLTAGISQAKQQIQGFKDEANRAGKQFQQSFVPGLNDTTEAALKLARQQERLTNQINRYNESVGRTRGQVLEARAQALGLSTAMQTQLASIRATEAALKQQTTTLNRYGLSAKQQAASLRGVPAQVTDIFVGLQGGQNPLTVLLQQGGQLKDMFGGLVPAARALGGALVALITPWTVLAAAVGVTVAAYVKGSAESEKFNAALITTGNVAGTTAARMADAAARIDTVVGTQAAAAEALAALASTGLVNGGNLEAFATTAIRLQRTLGTSVEDTAKQFAELGKDPVKASERLNQTMNYLTLDVYRQITALQEQGRQFEAGEVAQRAYASAMDERTVRLEGNLGTLQRLWRSVKDGASEAWDSMLGVGRPESLSEALEKSAANIERLRARTGTNNIVGGGGAAVATSRRRAEEELAAEEARMRNLRQGAASQNRFASEQGARQRREQQSIEAQQRLNELEKSTLSNAQKRAKEIEKMRRDAELTGLSLEKQNALEKAINERYKDPATRKTPAFQDNEATRYLLRLREINAALTEQTQAEGKVTEAEKERARFIQQIADLKEKRVLTADQKSLLANEEAIRKQLDLNVAVNAEVAAREAAAKALKEQTAAFDRYAQSVEALQINVLNAAQGRANQRSDTLASAGRGDRAREELNAQRQLNREYEKYEAQLTKNAARNGQLASPQFQQDLKAMKDAREAELAAQQDYFRQLEELRGNWLTGATSALENYVDATRDVAGRTAELFTTAFEGAEDALTKFVRTGKLDLASLADTLQEQITRSVLQTTITGPLAEAARGGLSGGGGIFGSVLGSLLGGKPSGDSAGGAAAGAGLAAVAAGSSAVVAAFAALTAAASTASVSLGGAAASSAVSGGGGSFWSSAIGWAGSLFGLAGGGNARAGAAYQVAENGPEMLTIGNRQVLMMGAQSGQVTPTDALSGNNTTQVVNFYNNGPIDRRTQTQIARAAGVALSTGSRNG